MIFTNKVTQVLHQVNSITNSVILKFPETVAVSETGDIQVLVNLEELGADEFPDIGLMDSLSEFLSLMKLFGDDRKIEFSNNTISIKEGKQSSTYISSNIALMDAYDKSPTQFSKTEEVPSVSTFTLGTEDIKQLKNASGVFKDLSEVIFKSEDGTMNVFLGATNKFNSRSNTYNVEKESESSKEFEIKIPVENFKSLPVSNYEVQIKYNSARDSYRILMINQSIQGFKVLMSVKI